jgi:hypothetical protein
LQEHQKDQKHVPVLKLSPYLLEVPAFFSDAPQIQYREGTEKEKEKGQVDGKTSTLASWNLEQIKFFAPRAVSKLIVLSLTDPPEIVPDFYKALIRRLRAHGMNVQRTGLSLSNDEPPNSEYIGTMKLEPTTKQNELGSD